MVDKLLNMALLGGEPILYILIGLSLVSVAVIAERYVIYAMRKTNSAKLTNQLAESLNANRMNEALALVKNQRAPEALVAKEGLQNFNCAPGVLTELMDSAALGQQQLLDRRLNILGTIGSNAPFIGLLGTVLGIIKAFNDLAFNAAGGASVVMAGISEALVATAVGLLVAIPAVMMFNYFKNRQKVLMENTARLQSCITAFVQERNVASTTQHTNPQEKPTPSNRDAA